jgi:flagellar assembly protein FliH
MSGILRDVVVGREARALARPGPAAAPAPAQPMAPPRAQVTAPAPIVDPAQQRKQADEEAYEQGRKRGYEDGYREAQARGREEGFASGQEQGLRNAQQEIERAQAAAVHATRERGQRLDELLGAMESSLRERLAASQEEMLALCFEAIAATFGELAARSDGVRALVRQALAQTRQLGPVTLHLHPKDLAMIQSDLQALADVQPAREVQFAADDGVALGGCVITSPQGGLDARIETQLARLGEVFRRARDEESA